MTLVLAGAVRNTRSVALIRTGSHAWPCVRSWQLSLLHLSLVVIVPNNSVQLFHVYEENDYSQTQNFVTTDLYLQLFHMHFSFLLRKLEEDKFIPILIEMMEGFLKEVENQMSKTTDQETIDALSYNAASYAIPLSILNGSTPKIAEQYKQQVNSELARIKSAEASTSTLLNAHKDFEFPYGQFKPRGHYTRTEALKKYFNAMQWLQLAPYCLEDQDDLKKAIVAAYILNNGFGKSGKSLINLYEAVLTPTTFLVGKPDNLSLLGICHIVQSKNYRDINKVIKPENMAVILADLRALTKDKNVIKPKMENTCPDKINFYARPVCIG